MENRLESFKGCLLGLAVGDAMGYAVDHKTLAQIREDYGPNGLLGYDLVNGYAEISSHTQLAAYSCNGLILGMTRGQMRGAMAPYVRYVAAAEQEWARLQGYRRDPSILNYCWISRTDSMMARRCMDTLMLDTLNRNRLGTLEEQKNRHQGPDSLTTAISVGLFFDPERMGREEVQRLGAEVVALTHGNPSAFLSGTALAHIISRICWDGETDLKALVRETAGMLQGRFSREYKQAAEVSQHLRMALALAGSPNMEEAQALDELECTTASRVLAGALYVCLLHPKSLDEALIAAVNHSGASAATGAVAGAIMGALLGREAIQEFYLECLEPADTLEELAVDMFQGCPMTMESRMFDVEWDEKYVSPQT